MTVKRGISALIGEATFETIQKGFADKSAKVPCGRVPVSLNKQVALRRARMGDTGDMSDISVMVRMIKLRIKSAREVAHLCKEWMQDPQR